MGACFSSEWSECQSSSSDAASTSAAAAAKVVTLKGDLHEYNVPVFVSQVLQAESSTAPNCFLCNSDSLLYDEYMPTLSPDAELFPDQIYFLLPTSKLQFKLSASDMAALAVKASVALQTAEKSGRNRKKARISPVLPVEKSRISLETQSFAKKKPASSSGPNNIGITRSRSVRKLQRYTSRRAKLAVRSFRLRLSTIYEGIVV